MSKINYRYLQPSLFRPGVGASALSNMSSQRFCLRWNNHQSNLLSVFDQLLHDESFVDVTLAVEGQLLRAHKMVLSACSPYFQALFVNHPDKHPIVILKDVPYNDMRSLLDFMYRGEVSVDQDRLTAFLRVAESLRIKGLTEVNEEKCDTITSSLMQQQGNNLPHLQRLQPQKRFGNTLNMLGNALMQPKRKRGRPRKLSGSSNGVEDYDRNDSLVTGSPEMLEVKMSMDGFSGHNSDSSSGKPDKEETDEVKVKKESEPVAGTSKEQQGLNNSVPKNNDTEAQTSGKFKLIKK
ncbi:protein tramtrack, beta isoform [Agrilus planipennis]|uniref:Protein tramtrack, beta isoform n=1 Tax=Agrilus planipennis TaxID=224129 RepID=A0A1W4XFH9_AGRPL|nr:protein tramtrack, beta isoform [Agrilus planipennis]XP_018334887.1 protein tramtrack, beta isoform [Agrilus planipennis]